MLGLIIFTLSGCGDDEGITSDRDTFIAAITGTWVVDENSVILLNNEDIAPYLIGFEITINDDLTYLTNRADITFDAFPWPESGNFILSDDLTEIQRNDGLLILIEHDEVTNMINLTFQADENSLSRLEGLSGAWKMILSTKE